MKTVSTFANFKVLTSTETGVDEIVLTKFQTTPVQWAIKLESVMDVSSISHDSNEFVRLCDDEGYLIPAICSAVLIFDTENQRDYYFDTFGEEQMEEASDTFRSSDAVNALSGYITNYKV